MCNTEDNLITFAHQQHFHFDKWHPVGGIDWFPMRGISIHVVCDPDSCFGSDHHPVMIGRIKYGPTHRHVRQVAFDGCPLCAPVIGYIDIL